MHTQSLQASLPVFGAGLRQWRMQRRLSQLDLAVQADVSTRHLSFVETGRSAPSREMVLRLAHCLALPMRERNDWLLAAGYAPMYRERGLDDADLASAREAVQRLLTCQEPFPAVAMDRHWNIVASNRTTAIVLAGASESLTGQGANVLRLCHHPEGLSRKIVNLAQLREHHVQRLQQQIRASADPVLVALLAELNAYPLPAASQSARAAGEHLGVVAPFQIESDLGVLSFFTASTLFGSVADITLSEMAMELFLPADALTSSAVPRLVQAASPDVGRA